MYAIDPSELNGKNIIDITYNGIYKSILNYSRLYRSETYRYSYITNLILNSLNYINYIIQKNIIIFYILDYNLNICKYLIYIHHDDYLNITKNNQKLGWFSGLKDEFNLSQKIISCEFITKTVPWLWFTKNENILSITDEEGNIYNIKCDKIYRV